MTTDYYLKWPIKYTYAYIYFGFCILLPWPHVGVFQKTNKFIIILHQLASTN